MKRVFEWHGRKYYLLGTGADGQNLWLEEARFDCGWYWGVGYIESFTNNGAPWNSKDIEMHTHFDYQMENQTDEYGRSMNWHDGFKKMCPETPLTDKEIWTVVELMRSLYTMRRYSDMIYRGGSHYTTNPLWNQIKDPTEYEYNRINKTLITAVLEKLYKILDGTARKEEEEGGQTEWKAISSPRCTSFESMKARALSSTSMWVSNRRNHIWNGN